MNAQAPFDQVSAAFRSKTRQVGRRMLAAILTLGGTAKQELAFRLQTSATYIGGALFVFATLGSAFYVGRLLESGRADLTPFFSTHPFIFAVFAPVLAAHVWPPAIATLVGPTAQRSSAAKASSPIGQSLSAVFLAGWVLAALALALTCSLWITANYLGAPDNGAITIAYLGSLLMAGGFLAIAAAILALVPRTLTASVLAASILLLAVVAGQPQAEQAISAWLPDMLAKAIVWGSPTQRFEAFTRGVIDLRDVVYAFSLIALGLSLRTLFVAEKRRAPAGDSYAFLRQCAVSLITLAIAVNAIASVALRSARLDFSENRIYALSEGARATLNAISEPIDITLFYPREELRSDPDLRARAVRVRALLQAYAEAADGKLRLTITDPAPLSEDEDRALIAALHAAEVTGGEPLSFGLLAENAVDDRRVIAVFEPERAASLEYELTRIIADLENPARPKIALLTGVDQQGRGGQPIAFSESPSAPHVFSTLARAFTVETLPSDFNAVPADADLVALIHPPTLNDAQLDAVDQFILAKGRALILLDPHARHAAKAETKGRHPQSDVSSDLAPLLRSWGVKYNPDAVILDKGAAQTVQFERRGASMERPYPLWLKTEPAFMNDRDLVTGGLPRGVSLASAGALKPALGASTRFTPLIWSTNDARMADALTAIDDPSPSFLLAGFQPDAPPGGYVIAARVSGDVKAVFDKAPDGADDPSRLRNGSIEVILLADSDIIDDGFYMRAGEQGAAAIADNADFILNAVSVLTGPQALVSLRARAEPDRSMRRLEELRARAQRTLGVDPDRLRAKIAATTAQLAAFERRDKETTRTLDQREARTPDEQAELERVQKTLLQHRAQLRIAERALQTNAKRLAALLTLINVWLIPALIVAVGLWLTSGENIRGQAR